MNRPVYYFKRGVFGGSGKKVIRAFECWINRYLVREFAVYKWQHGREYWWHKGKWEKDRLTRNERKIEQRKEK